MIIRTLLLALIVASGACNSEPTWLLEQLDSTNPAVRQDAVVSAGGVDHILITAKLETMLADSDISTRIAVVDALALHHSLTSVEPLIGMLQDQSPVVVSKVIDTLGQLKDPAAVPALTKILQAETGSPPLNAIWAIGQLGDQTIVPLLSKLRDHPDRWVRHGATQALRNLN
jgi:HEAT repeat protein